MYFKNNRNEQDLIKNIQALTLKSWEKKIISAKLDQAENQG